MKTIKRNVQHHSDHDNSDLDALIDLEMSDLATIAGGIDQEPISIQHEGARHTK